VQPFRNEGKAVCLEDASAANCFAISGEKVKHRAERRAQYETVALVPSFLQGRTSIDTSSSGILEV